MRRLFPRHLKNVFRFCHVNELVKFQKKKKKISFSEKSRKYFSSGEKFAKLKAS